MRIVHVNADRGIRPDGTKGAAIHGNALVAALRARGDEVTELWEPLGTTSTARATHRVITAATSGGAEVVYERYSIGHLGGLRAAQTLRLPFALEVNAPLLREASAHRGHTVTPSERAAESELFRRADVVRVVSPWLARYVATSRGTAQGVHVIANGHDPMRFVNPADFSSPPSVVFLGHPKPWHGADRLVDILDRLERRGLRIDAKIIGGGPVAVDIARQANERGLTGRLSVTGPVAPDRVGPLLAEAWIGLAPYPPTENFYFCPLKVLDYLGAGLPVVATDLEGVGSLIGPGGMTVAPGDVDAIVDAVGSLAVDPSRARALGRAGRRHVRERHTWAHVATAIGLALTRIAGPVAV